MLSREYQYQIDQLQEVIHIYRDMANTFNKHQMYEVEGRLRSNIENAQHILQDLLHLQNELDLEEAPIDTID